MRRLKLSPLSTMPCGKSTMPTPPQFFTGASPDIAEALVMPVVPYVRKKLVIGFANSSSDVRTCFMISGLDR